MDGSRFDHLVRSLTAVRSRRGLTRLLGGLAAAAVPLALGTGDAVAGSRIGGTPCTRDGQCLTNRCVGPKGSKKCSCSSQFKQCKQPDNTCKRARCHTDTQRCVVSNEPPDVVACTLPNAEGVCAGGACTVKACAAGFGNCDGEHANGCETDTNTSAQHCGACNDPCGPNQTCVDKVCTGGTTCPTCPGDKVCNEATDGFCSCPVDKPVQCEFNSARCSADPNTDSKRCGFHCYDCELSFAPGYRCCNGQCVNGCGPNTSGSCQEGPCGANCEPCSGGKVCCNLGPGTTSQCVDPGPLGYCPAP